MPRTLAYSVIDAFTDTAFTGNPAAVIRLEMWPKDALLQQIAAELSLSETAFHAPEPGGDGFRLRWFTPSTEVDLCGHATLATAFVMGKDAVRFHTRSGVLTVTSLGDRYVLDFPARVAERVEDEALIAAAGEALGAPPTELWQSRNLMAVYGQASTVRKLAPDMRRVLALPTEGVIVTAPGDQSPGPDFVSRYFTPQHGIDEDPVTGSAHCTLAPYWGQRLGLTAMSARQVSRRGGDLVLEVAGDRVLIGGRAVLTARGELHLP
jgi:predicted PhzF superfamily epimerase YddE/YHI9